MSGLILYNGLHEIINTIHHLPASQKAKDIVWFGNAREVPLINAILSEGDQKISYVIDNDSKKWNHKISEVYHVDYYQSICPSGTSELIIHSSELIDAIKDHSIFMLSSRYNHQIIEQLVSLHVKRENIYAFSTSVENGIMTNDEVKCKIRSCNRMDLKQLQQTEFHLLEILDDYCKKNNLRYFLAGGTLIGAVRHHGFIPWDDDIDVYMPYEDYLSLMQNFPKKGRYLAIDWNNEDNYFLPFGKLMDTETYLIHSGYPLQGLMNVYIDIFPIAGHVAPEEREERWGKNREMDDLWTEYYIARDFFPEKAVDIRQKVMDFRYGLSFDEEDYVGTMQIIPKQKQWAIDRGCYASATELTFEGKSFKAPKGFDEYLTLRYGDYMKLPCEKDRVTHSFYSYQKMK